jgi:hypothetical protein
MWKSIHVHNAIWQKRTAEKVTSVSGPSSSSASLSFCVAHDEGDYDDDDESVGGGGVGGDVSGGDDGGGDEEDDEDDDNLKAESQKHELVFPNRTVKFDPRLYS